MKEIEEFYQNHKKPFEYALHIIRSKGYEERILPKKNGSSRLLKIPPKFSKVFQKKFSELLSSLYIPPKSVHGFVKSRFDDKRNIVTNASSHINKAIVINLDIENFFDTINFGRVRGLFLSKPFFLNESVATKIAQLTTYQNTLPQGAPTSPIISNLICRKMDHSLIQLAKKYSITYTRYADDLTFSTHNEKTNTKNLLQEIKQIIQSNGFDVNPTKTRVQYYYQTQIVTGLKVNQKVNITRKYIRQIRSMLHEWHKHGLYPAANNHFKSNRKKIEYKKKNKTSLLNKILLLLRILYETIFFSSKKRVEDNNIFIRQYEDNEKNSFKRIVLGKINFLGQVKGLDDYTYIKFRHIYYLLNDEFFLNKKAKEFEHLDINKLKRHDVLKVFTQIYSSLLIFTEGETDIIYIKAALKHFKKLGKFMNLKIRFCNLQSVSNVKKMHQVFYEKTRDIDILNIRKCILPYVKDDLKICFLLDSDSSGEVNYFLKMPQKNYFLIDKENKGYVEKLFDHDIVVEIIEEHGYIIDVDNEKLQKTSKKGLEQYQSSSAASSDNLNTISGTGYVAYKKKIIKKTDLAEIITKNENTNYDKFENIFTFLENMVDHKDYIEPLCCKSIY